MNPIFLRSQTESNTKPNLEKLHKLIKNGNSTAPIDEDKKMRKNIPNNWIYNENAAKQIWDDIEKSIKVTSFEETVLEENPFKKIDESAARIRQTIANYEIQDQDLLMDLLDALDNESAVDNLDQESLLTEARVKLLQMITDHVDNSEEQKNMLDSIRYWFSDLQKGKSNDDPDFKNDKFDAKSFLDFMKKMTKDKEESAESAMNLHSDIVSMLMKRINEIQKTLTQKEFLLSQEAERNGNSALKQAKRGRRPMNTRASFDVDKELSVAQRKISELQSQVTNLKQALIEYAKPTKDGEEKPSIAPLISLEKEFELDQKISVLTDEIKTLKTNNKLLQTQIGKSKQSELVLQNKLANAEKAKKAMEQDVQSMNQKIEQMETVYQEKIKVIKNEALISKESDGNLSLAESQKYQKEIQEMNRLHQEAISTMMKENERRFRQQMKELTSAYESGDQSKILSTTVENYNNEIKNLREQCENQIEAQKKLFSSQLMELTANYEKIIAKKDKEREMLKESFDSTLKATEMTSKLNFEEEERKKLFELNEKQNEELIFMRVDFTKKVDDLKRKLDRAVHERDTLRNLIETSAVATLLDDLNFDEEFEEEEEEEKNEEESVQFKSKLLIKQREAEKNATDKYLNIIDNQKKILKDVFNWEIEHAKVYYQHEFENNLSDFREKTVEKIQQLYKNIPDSQTTLEDLLTTIIKQISNSEHSISSSSMIPTNEVELKMDELTTRLVDLESENHVYKRMFDKVGSDLSTAQKEDVFNSIRDSIQEKVENETDAEEDRNLLSKQATEVKNDPSQNSSSSTTTKSDVIESKVDDDDKKKTAPKSPARRKARLTKTMPRVIIHYYSAAKTPTNTSNSNQQQLAQQFTQSKKTENEKSLTSSSATTTPKKTPSKSKSSKENQICCPDCSCRFEYQQNQIKKKLYNVSYVSCPECLSQYNLKFDEVSETSTKTSSQTTQEQPNFSVNQEIIEENQSEMIKRLQEAEDDAIEMRKIFIEYSLRIINMLKKNATSSPSKNAAEKTKKMKYETCFDISKKISDFNIAPQGTLKMSNTDILERLKDREIHPPDPDQIIEQVRSLLMQLSTVRLIFSPRETNLTDTKTISTVNQISNVKISGKNLETMKKIQSHLKNQIKQEIKPMFLAIAESTNKLIEEHKSIINKLKDSYIELSKKSATENVKNKQMMDAAKSELMKEREENKKSKETIRKNQEAIETLESKLNDSVSKLQQIAIQNEMHQKNIAAFKQIEEEGKQSIDSMTEQILKLREIIHQQEKEIDILHLNNQSLEATIELFNTGKNCKFSREYPVTIIHYPDSEEEQFMQVPHLGSVSNLSQQQQQNASILTPGSVKSERIRCRVTNNGNNNSCRPQSAARVFVPAKSKATITKTPRNAIPTVDIAPIYSETYEQFTDKDNNDGNSSIVVYVTPFIKEKPNQIPRGSPGLLPANIYNANDSTSSNNNNNNHNGSTNYISNNSFFNINPGKTAAVTVNNEGSSSKYLVAEKLPFKENEVNTSYFKQLESRIRSLEKQLLEMQTKIHLEKDKTHEANQALFRAGVQNMRAVREIKKQIIYKENAVKGMTKALAMVSDRDKKIKMLSTKLSKFNKIAATISDKIEENEKEEKSILNIDEDGKSKKKQRTAKFLIDDEEKLESLYEKILKSLNSNQIFSAMAQNEMRTIARIQQMRKKAIEVEQNRIIGALDAMCFLTQPPMRPAASVKVTSHKSLTPKKPIKKSIHVPINTKM